MDPLGGNLIFVLILALVSAAFVLAANERRTARRQRWERPGKKSQ